MWRHLSIAVAAHKTVVQSVRSNRWRFNFEMASRGGQINFLGKTVMIITNTMTSILKICPFPRGLLLTYPQSPPPSTSSRNWGFQELDGSICHKFSSDPRQTSMCLKRLLCNQGTPPVILTKNINIQNMLKLLIMLLRCFRTEYYTRTRTRI